MAKLGKIGWSWTFFQFEYNEKTSFIGIPMWGQTEKLNPVNDNQYLKSVK